MSDSSPLIVLAKAGLLPRAVALFDRLLVPPAVVAEIAAGRPREDAAFLLAALDGDRLHRCPRPKPLPFETPPGLATGEREVLAAALQRSPAVLMDDRLALRTARMLGLATLRTGRVLLLMVKRGELSPAEFEATLHRLVGLGFRLAPADLAALVRAAEDFAR